MFKMYGPPTWAPSLLSFFLLVGCEHRAPKLTKGCNHEYRRISDKGAHANGPWFGL